MIAAETPIEPTTPPEQTSNMSETFQEVKLSVGHMQQLHPLIRTLKLVGCTSDCWEHIGKMMERLKALESITIDDCKGSSTMARSICTLRNLLELRFGTMLVDVVRCGLTIRDAVYLVQLQQLEVLDLGTTCS